jgi:SAM-dependent methyltransferase
MVSRMGLLQRIKQRSLTEAANFADGVDRRRDAGAGVNARPGANLEAIQTELATIRDGVSKQEQLLSTLNSRVGELGLTRSLPPQTLSQEHGSASRILYERLNEQDIADVEALLNTDPGASEQLRQATSAEARRYVTLTYGVWLGAPAVLEKTGLSAALPPEDVHAMARGPLSAAGGTYEADMVANALESVGVELASLSTGLDFGCSSGRVVRVLAAAYPDTQWHGCDPNGPAIEWATENLPGIEFFVSGDAPPLQIASGSLDLAYAISIWSHFEPQLGLRWFDEMHRLIRPGGYLVCTTHGSTSVAHYAESDLRTPEQSREILDALYRQDYWYAPEFGEQGDWGVVNPDWGTAFLSPEWVLAQLCPRWRVLEYAPGRNQANQDVYVLQRV